MKLCLRTSLAAWLLAGSLAADVTYNQTTKFKGGTLIDMVQKMANMPLMGRMMGGNMKQAFEDQHYEVSVKGNKMARIGGLMSTLYDLDAGTLTSIDNTKQTYTVQSFDELKQRMQQMQERMNKGQGGDIDFDVKSEKTGQTQMINSESAAETLITMTAKQASAQGQMVVKVHAWMVPAKPAMEEVRDFQKRLAEKMGFAASGFSSPAMGSAGTGISAGLREAFKQQDGYPALTDLEVSGVTAGGPMGGNSDPNAVLMRMETLTDNFGKGAVDDSKFVVPAGYKEEKVRGRR